MQDQKHNPRTQVPIEHDIKPDETEKLTVSDGVRQYEGGKNPDMQVQKGNRQGSGIPTQQRTEDR